MTDATPVYAIIRYDDGSDEPTVVKVVRSEERADWEVSRLTEANGGKGCRYEWQYTRFEDADD